MALYTVEQCIANAKRHEKGSGPYNLHFEMAKMHLKEEERKANREALRIYDIASIEEIVQRRSQQ